MIHLLYGADTYSLSEELNRQKADFKRRAPRGVIEDLAAASDDSEFLARLQGVFQNQGLFGSEKFIIIRDFLDLAAKMPRSESFLSPQINSLPNGYEVIFAEAGDVDTRRVFFKQLKKIATLTEFTIPEGKEYYRWIEKRARGAGFKFENGVLEKFPVFDLWQAASELEKLMLYKAESKFITASDIATLVRPNLGENVFNLTNLFAEKRAREAVRTLNQLLAAGPAYELKNQAIMIVGALAGQIRSLLLVKSLQDKTNDDLAATLGWKPGRVWINRRLAAKFEEVRLARMLRDLHAIDMRLKTSEEPPQLLLALFLQKAAMPTTAGTRRSPADGGVN